MLREIRLYGHLGQRFGRVHYLAVRSVGEAIRALRANFPAFEAAMLGHRPGFKVWTGKTRVVEAGDINGPSGEREVIRIAPAVAGAAKQGFGQVILGAVLIAAAVVGNFFFPANPVSPYLMNAGVAMVIGGVAQMLSPQPQHDPGSDDKTRASYVFNGPINTTAQGNPVPVGYGRLIIGSAVISAGLSTEDIPV